MERDLARLAQEIAALPDEETLWRAMPGISNSIGNLALHLEGNLREFVGNQFGGVAYRRERDAEFTSRDTDRADLARRIAEVRALTGEVLRAAPEERYAALCPEQRYGLDMTWRQFLMHLAGHLNYHLGQIDYVRRALTGEGALDLAPLERS
jgi:uncharacterized damage-inducible protein DinB